MTPKEKAKELVDSFIEVNRKERYQDDLGVFEAKQCALICVDEIVNSHYVVLVGVKHSILQHYSQVILEIHKL
jgi:hypothetical protein